MFLAPPTATERVSNKERTEAGGRGRVQSTPSRTGRSGQEWRGCARGLSSRFVNHRVPSGRTTNACQHFQQEQHQVRARQETGLLNSSNRKHEPRDETRGVLWARGFPTHCRKPYETSRGCVENTREKCLYPAVSFVWCSLERTRFACLLVAVCAWLNTIASSHPQGFLSGLYASPLQPSLLRLLGFGGAFALTPPAWSFPSVFSTSCICVSSTCATSCIPQVNLARRRSAKYPHRPE